MFIQTEATPNPATLKFLPGRSLAPGGPVDCPTAAAAEARSPLAARLFGVAGVEGVFLGADFVSVTKAAAEDWMALKPAVLGVIMEHLTAGLPVLSDGGAAPAESAADGADADGAASPEDAAVVAQIRELLETRVRPAVARDGGDIVFHRYEDGVVHLSMRGACAGCPSATATLKMGVENMLRHYIPQIQEVRAEM